MSDNTPRPLSTNIEGESTALQARVVEYGTLDSNHRNDTGKIESMAAPKGPDPGLANYLRVFRYGTLLDYALIAACCITSIGSGIAFPLMNIVFGQLVGVFTDYFVPGTEVTRAEFQAEINTLTLYIVYLFVAKFVLSYVSMLCIRISGLRMSAALRLAYLRAMFAQSVATIDTISPGKVSTRITTSSNTVQLAISQHFAMLFQSLAFTIGLYVVSFVKGWLLTLVASAALPFILVVYGFIVPPFIKIQKVTAKHLEDASAMAFEMFSSVRVVVAFGAEAKLARQYELEIMKAGENEKKAAPLMGLMMAPQMMAMYGTFGLTFWYGIKRASEGHGNVGDITVVLFSVMMAVMNIGRLAAPIMAIVQAATAAHELFITIDSPILDTSGVKEPEITADVDITFANVAFSYPSRPNVQVLDRLDLTLKAGKVTAIVGPSGSGKSTIVGLVQRWYELAGTTAFEKPDTSPTVDEQPVQKPKRFWQKSKDNDKKPEASDKPKKEDVDLGPNTCTGTIRVGETDLRNVDLKWWRSQVGLVQQEPFLFNDTIFNNVAFGLCGTQMQDLSKDEKTKMVEEACREAYAEEFVLKLPQGYETLVGESGIKLSGGQRQRIAIARSIIKQPTILILDEATSAIDVRTERIVQQALDRVSRNRTTIVIAHRLSTIKRADKIVVLRKGQLVEEGTHDELVRLEAGVYHGLVYAQELAMEPEGTNDISEEAQLERVNTSDFKRADAKSHTSEVDPEYKERGLVLSFGRLLYEQRRQWFLYSVAAAGILMAGAIYPLQAFIFAKIIEVFTFTGDKLVSRGNFWAGMFGVEAAAVGIAYFVLGYALRFVECIVTTHYGQEYLNNMMRKRIAWFDEEGHSPGSLVSRLSSDVMQLRQLMTTEMSIAMIAVVNLVGSLIISFVYGWKLTLVALFSIMPIILGAGYTRMRLEIQFEKKNAEIFAESSQFATEAVGAFRTVLSLIMEDMIGDRYQTLLSGHVKHAFGNAKYSTIVFAASDSLELGCMALAFWYGGTLLAKREYDVVDFFVVYTAVVQGAIAAGMWFSFAPNMAQATGAANRILSLRPPKDIAPPTYTALRNPSGGVGVEFQDVDFVYKSRDTQVLSKLNLQVGPGQFAALVGASGCGKSTTISLLERFYDVTAGSILYNGQDVTTLDPFLYRQQLSLVSQEPTLYEGTIKENVALSVNSATDAAIEAACTDAQIHEFIASLPDGYNTRLGPKGMSLSGGQKQRLSLARALLRKPKLLLLDEATSSLDSESEKLVQAAIERAAGDSGRTVIAVAHRLATIQKADIIFVMGSGRVLEQGSHQELLKRRGVYWQMCQAQALDR
ncbi:lipid A export ATP-binding/permease protein-like protein msbA [Boeremia exigua]|uniref:lipid A export ATP-binding/permease protein-like protein msbA n=1 Tax=Boeremia exigua TaxID=749465 RepID=UPI001E8D321A|nr:lipid A export ATP-binding/permease protein-like protein msbA [Boeremia exigua]KAH6629396.1 lipid A export ATP-binding/permease protein-like protein msbA [Boeremia exigua]